jgi:hypothetical protein
MLVALLSGYQAISAATPKEERIKVLFNLQTNKKVLSSFSAQLMAQTQWQDEQKKNIVQEKITDILIDAFEKTSINIYSRLFTESEVEELIAFYSSAIGKKTVDESPTTAAETKATLFECMAKAQKIIAEESKVTAQPAA